MQIRAIVSKCMHESMRPPGVGGWKGRVDSLVAAYNSIPPIYVLITMIY